MRKANVALGFYQNEATASVVVRRLRAAGVSRVATIQNKRETPLIIKKYFPFIIDNSIINRFKGLVVVDEILVIAEVKSKDVRKSLSILRQVKSGHPITFLIRSEITEELEKVEVPREPLTPELLEKSASDLASGMQDCHLKKTDQMILLNKLNMTEKVLQFLRHDVAEAEYIEQTITISAEWMLDNMHVIESSIDDVRRNFTQKYYMELPKLSDGPYVDLPRIYGVAVELINNTAARLTKENIVNFLNSFQTVTPLTIGELWAFPLMLRLRLLECLQSLSIHVDRRMYEGELASFWGNRLLTAGRRENEKLPVFLAKLEEDQSHPSYHFAEELMDHLFDEETILLMLRSWLEQRFNKPVSDIIEFEQKSEAADQQAFASSIVSLITLSQLSWKDIFEEISKVDEVLRKDPIGYYSHMSFDTRNAYRNRVEEIAKKSKLSELEIAQEIILLAEKGSDEVEKHVGYYLIDEGRKKFEFQVGYRPDFATKLKEFIRKYATGVYLLSVALLTLLLEAVVVYQLIQTELSLLFIVSLALIAIIPLNEIAVQFLQMLFVKILPPTVLPKMSYEKGIPTVYKTLVVVPSMLLSEESIEEELHRLEIRYLANTDDGLLFALFTDFIDASEKNIPNDSVLLEKAINGIRDLDHKYGEGKFFLFHRQRVWSDSENAWIGWERKRGKLEYLNRYLARENLDEDIVYFGKKENLQSIRFVITLDSDTQLPKNKGRALVEVISHPLNVPRLSETGRKVKRGFTIIQPRVTTDFAHLKSSWFSWIFAETSSVDPYSQAISNLYQDLMGEGTYHGKGIYDVEVFNKILCNRFPKEHLLSHDLLEGTYVRVGFASDICLYDQFPQDYLSWLNRQHRWMRGDFQIIDWLFAFAPCADGSHDKNPLTWLNRWKIFDNIRRALLPVFLLLLLLLGWFSPQLSLFFNALVTLTIFMPTVMIFLDKIISFSFPKSFMTINDLGLSFLRSLITISVLPYAAIYSLDALIRVIYRRFVSRRKLLEWITFGYGNRAMQKAHFYFLIQLGCLTIFAILLYLLISYAEPEDTLLALPFCLLWAAAPLIIYYIDRPIEFRPDRYLSQKDKELLRLIARKTWRFFDDFVGPATSWLPPDNYQTALKVEVAMRTSPTNIGLWLLSVLSAYDMKYLTFEAAIERIKSTIQSLKRLERYEGHFLNWYNLENLGPLFPRYISTVDSGNLLACFWTLEQGLFEIAYQRVLDSSMLDSMNEILALAKHELQHHPQPDISQLIDELKQTIALPPKDTEELVAKIRKSKSILQGKLEDKDKYLESVYWMQKLEKYIASCDSLIDRYLSWLDPLMQLKPENPEAQAWKRQALQYIPTINELVTGEIALELEKLVKFCQQPEASENIKASSRQIKEKLVECSTNARDKLSEIDDIIKETRHFSDGTNMNYLYNRQRKLFHIGYNVDDKKYDNSFYDLLASEARIASIVAIAKGDVPVDNWWALGRSYTIQYGRKVLLSWSGSMFEYLMPLIFNRPKADTLLGQACVNCVACQIIYGKKRGIPWGISEAAFSAIDLQKTYQYRGFGVPGLGLKRDLEHDLVVSPYSTALALPVDAPSALKNFRKLQKIHREEVFSRYGYYESIDFTRQQTPEGARGVIVYAYMAHHQGMILTSINNIINNDIIIQLFHADPRIAGVEELLFERMPTEAPIKIKGFRGEIPRLKPFSPNPIMGVVETPYSVTPKVNLLSNGDYSIMVTNAGGGYSQWKDFDITRWTADTTRDAKGNFIYINDLNWNKKWSVAFQPTLVKSPNYSVNFKADKAEFKRRDYMIETHTEITVSPEDNAEVWNVTFTNHSTKTRYLEITSYLELVLAKHATDRAHPCFNKLFIETEVLPEYNALLAFRRPRSSEEPHIWVGHVVSSSQTSDEVLKYETDRARFIGRNKTLQHPEAIDGDLTNTVGTVLDPIFSLRKRIVIKPGQRVKLSFVTAAADSKEGILGLIKKYKDLPASDHVFSLAWTFAQLQLRHLRIHQEDVQLFQKLASRILYPHIQMRPSEESLRSNRLGQSQLWQYGISGDLPIVIVSVGDVYDLEVVRQVLIAHAFISMRGLKFDLIIINEEATGYEQPIYQQLLRMIHAYAYKGMIDVLGGAFLINSDKITPPNFNLLFAVSSAVIVASRGSLRQQLVSPLPSSDQRSNLIINQNVKEVPSRMLPYLELPYFNGFGGYSKDGKKYVIYLGPNTNTPLPWINVISNSRFGCLVSETGLGTTWYENSQTNRLTPWSNDPVINPITDTIYIRDDDLGVFWTPTPSPVRELDAYRTTHGQGYSRFEHNSHGIEQELLIFVPVDDNESPPIRIQKLKLFNNSPLKRKLSVTAYSELVLGTNKEQTQMHIITDWDYESQSFFAYNRYNPDFGEYLCFSTSLNPINSFTGDRTDFIGRNSSTSNPEAMYKKNLSGRSGAGLDACLALQAQIELDPGKETEIIFIMGYANSPSKARKMIHDYRQPGAVDELLKHTTAWWEKMTETIQVEIPDLATCFYMNRWLPYQNLSCRFWGRSAFYQSSGAYGFRDQLQDSMAIVYSKPELARAQILRAAGRQFIEGDVQHWWHPTDGGGIRTRISDDLLWLPFVTAHYVRTTGDLSILNENIPFLKAPLLTEEEHEAYQIPVVSEEVGTLLEHCRRTLEKGITSGPHGLPLIGTGDWNDGLNRVGVHGRGESVWLGWFLIHVMNDFAELLEKSNGKGGSGDGYRTEAKRLAQIIEDSSWDGEWYRRAYYDDGTPLGTKTSPECTIDSIAQSWAVISGHGNPERIKKALNSAEQYLVIEKYGLSLLLTPPFDKLPLDPGYIKGYPPGVRENGGQYTHGSLWLPLALIRVGEIDKAIKILNMMLPVNHTKDPDAVAHYKGEPYVMPGDVYDLNGQKGRCGWSWYTGSCAWIYRIWLEEILGFKLRGETLYIDCTIPNGWAGFKLHYRYKSATYHINVQNPNKLNRLSKPYEVRLSDDGQEHVVDIVIS